jgi:hypothetical protein
MRDPSPTLYQWDRMSCETACVGQLLYMHEVIELDELLTLDQRIGRKEDEADLENGNLRLLFETGFFVREVSSVDVERLAGRDGMPYLRSRWIEAGDDEEEVDGSLQEVYPKIRARAIRKLKIIDTFSRQYEHVLRDATPHDLSDMVSQGWQVRCDVIRPHGESHALLVIQRVSGGRYQVFDSLRGVSTMAIKQFAARLLPGLQGYRLPAS